MPKEEAIEMRGVVIEALANSMFRVRLKDDYMILAYPSGRIRKYFIRILPGDVVTVNLSPYDLSKGRITYRHK